MPMLQQTSINSKKIEDMSDTVGLAEIVQFEVQCSNRPVRVWPRYRYSPGQKQIVMFTDRRRIGEVRHIDLETMTYEVRWAEYVHETGICKPVP
jgi:hypothetical protein